MIGQNLSSTAMILGAGFGKRLKPLTDHTPKPLLQLQTNSKQSAQPLIAFVMQELKKIGVENCVVNTHHLPHLMAQYLQTQTILPAIISWEQEILETGGGVRNAIEHFHDKPFVVSSADIWIDGSPFQTLIDSWDETKMDALLLVVHKNKTMGYSGAGDYDFSESTDNLGRLEHRATKQVAPYVFTGIQILHPRLFKDKPIEKFPLIDIFNQAQKNDRLYGVAHNGLWADLGTHESFQIVQNHLQNL